MSENWLVFFNLLHPSWTFFTFMTAFSSSWRGCNVRSFSPTHEQGFIFVVIHLFDGETWSSLYCFMMSVVSSRGTAIWSLSPASSMFTPENYHSLLNTFALLLTTRKNNPKIVYQHLENNTWKVQALMNFLWV